MPLTRARISPIRASHFFRKRAECLILQSRTSMTANGARLTFLTIGRWDSISKTSLNSTAVLNGIYLGRHASGYTPFRYDVSDFVNYGGKNILVVRADATLGEGWWYEGAGVYRHVWLSKTNPVHVAHNGTFVKSELGRGSASLSVSTEIDNDSDSEQGCRVLTKIVDPGGRSIAEAQSTPLSIPAVTRREFRQELTINNPALW